MSSLRRRLIVKIKEIRFRGYEKKKNKNTLTSYTFSDEENNEDYFVRREREKKKENKSRNVLIRREYDLLSSETFIGPFTPRTIEVRTVYIVLRHLVKISTA